MTAQTTQAVSEVRADLEALAEDAMDLLAHPDSTLTRSAEDIAEATDGIGAVLARVGPPPKGEARG